MKNYDIRASLPPAMRQGTEHLLLFESRNIPGTIKTADRKAFLRDNPLPSQHEPDTFVDKMLKLEMGLGTTLASLAGLFTAAGELKAEKVLAGIERFEQIVSLTKAKLPAIKIKPLYKLLGKKLYNSPYETDPSFALSSTLENMGGQDIKIGNCILGAGIFALVGQELGLSVQAAHALDEIHALAYFNKQHRNYETGPGSWFSWRRTSLNWAYSNKKLVIGSSFLYTAMLMLSILLRKVRDLNEDSVFQKNKVPGSKASLLALQTVETIDPFFSWVSKLRSDCYSLIGDPQQAAEHSRYAKSLRALAKSKGPAPIIRIPTKLEIK
ncbi:MAG: hypothetical protein PHH14_06475 [Candidatus Margulisbacteria bacterium]|nr:hypothetical protein [Candidatus Margulisiibacteriota bacterium]